MVEDWSGGESFYHEASDRYYTMSKRDGKYFQRRHQAGFEGKIENVVEKEIHFIIGSGNHARTYLHRTPSNQLVELPVAWYAENGGFWAMNPGYDRPDHPGFRRVISNDCMFCHNGYPEQPEAGFVGGGEALFPGRLPEGIDCQRCHGPGKEHVDTAVAEMAEEEIRRKIFNPAGLPVDRQLELCMQCHLESTSRSLPYSLVRFSRRPFSYRPWEALGDYIIHFDFETGKGLEDHFEIAHHAYRLRKSACFRKGEGLVCTSCHNPHEAVRGAEQTERTATVCLDCHGEPHTESRDCADCHMPKRRADDVVHAVMTDHFIRKPPSGRNWLAPLEETHETQETAYRGEVTLYYPPELPETPENELLLATAQVYSGANLEAGISRLRSAIERRRPERPEYYHHLAEAYWKSNNLEEAAHWYRRALERDPEFLPSVRNLGSTLIAAGKPAEAVSVLRLAPEDPASLVNQGDALLAQGRFIPAAEALRKAVGLNPDLPEAWTNLTRALGGQGDMAGAINAAREAVRLQPDSATAHSNLANYLEASDNAAEAEYHYKTAITMDPLHAEAFYNYGTALAGQKRYREAESYLQRSVEIDPALAGAHLNLGNLQAAQGSPGSAIPHFLRALQAQPRFAAARMNLGLALAETGRMEEAVAEFQKAAEGPDPQIQQAAREILGRLSGAQK